MYKLLFLTLLMGLTSGTIAQEVELFLEEVLSDRVEYGATLTPDKKTVYFVKTDSFYVSKPKSIYKTTLNNGKWTTPKPVHFSGKYSDSSPFVSPDGKRLFFASRRPVKHQKESNNNLWYVNIENGQEGQPIYLTTVNSEKSEYSPSVDQEGNLYFGSYREGGFGSGDLWYAAFKNGSYETPENLGKPVNSEHGEWGSCISPDGSYLIFENSGKPQNLSASGDLYISFKHQGRWQKPIHLKGDLNSIGSDLTPRIHGTSFYFASNRKKQAEAVVNWNNVDLYTISLTDLMKDLDMPGKVD